MVAKGAESATLFIGMLMGAQVSAKLFSMFVQGREVDVLLGWRNYWLIPCIAAAVVMVIFALLFRDRKHPQER